MMMQQSNSLSAEKEGPGFEMERYDRHELEQSVQA